MRRAVAGVVGLLALGSALVGFAQERELPKSGVNVDLRLMGDLSGDGQQLDVEWYRRGPVRIVPHTPPSFVRGIEVRGLAGHVLAHWESEETTLTDFYRDLNGLWALSGEQGLAIAGAVQYGGSVIDLYVFRLEQGQLKQVWTIGGRGVIVKSMDRRRVIIVDPGLMDLPKLYAWNGQEFVGVDSEFPEFWSRQAATYAKQIYDPQPVPPRFLSLWCEQSLRAYRLAGEPERGRKSCLQAKTRIGSGAATRKGNENESATTFEAEKRQAISKIDQLLGRLAHP